MVCTTAARFPNPFRAVHELKLPDRQADTSIHPHGHDTAARYFVNANLHRLIKRSDWCMFCLAG